MKKENRAIIRLKPNKDINATIIKKVEEGYPLRKAISLVGLKDSNLKNK